MHHLVRGGNMSKIGRKAIELGGVQVEVKGQEIRYKGSKDSGMRVLPQELIAKMDNGKLFILANESYAKKLHVVTLTEFGAWKEHLFLTKFVVLTSCSNEK